MVQRRRARTRMRSRQLKKNPVYIWLAIARKTGQIVGFSLKDRTRKSAIDF